MVKYMDSQKAKTSNTAKACGLIWNIFNIPIRVTFLLNNIFYCRNLINKSADAETDLIFEKNDNCYEMTNVKSEKKVDTKRSTYFLAQVKDIVNRSAVESTAHGLLNISQANDWFLRLAWILCLLASFGYCLYCVVDVTTDYFNYPVVSKVEVVDELTTYFPSVM